MVHTFQDGSKGQKVDVQQALPVGNSPQIVPVAALLKHQTSSKTAQVTRFPGGLPALHLAHSIAHSLEDSGVVWFDTQSKR